MTDTINQITLLAQAILLAIGYPGIFLIVFIENFFGPIPLPPILPLSGMLAAQGKMNFFAVWFTAVAGAMVGALALYTVGRWLDERVIRSLLRRYGRHIRYSEEQLDRTLALFNRYGGAAIIIGRTIPVLRNAVSLTAGMSRFSVPQFLFYSALISTPSIGIWIYMGFLLGENWQAVLETARQVEIPLIAVVILIVLIVALFWAARRWRKERAMLKSDIQ